MQTGIIPPLVFASGNTSLPPTKHYLWRANGVWLKPSRMDSKLISALAQISPNVWTGECGAGQLASVHDSLQSFSSATQLYQTSLRSLFKSRLLHPSFNGPFTEMFLKESDSSLERKRDHLSDITSSVHELLHRNISPADLGRLKCTPLQLKSLLFEPIFYLSAMHSNIIKPGNFFQFYFWINFFF